MRRAAALAAFATVLVAVLAGGHYYIARRLVLDPGLPEPWRGLALGALTVLAVLLVFNPVAERLLGPPASRLIAWPASLWMGLAFLLLVLLGASDLVLGLGGAAAHAAGAVLPAADTAAAARALVVFGAALALAALGLRIALAPPALRRLELRLPRWPRALDGFRIVQISDLHIGPILGRRFASALVERINALAPDLVAVTGDLVDGDVRRLREEVAPFAALRARHGVWFVTGNHDHYSGADAWVRRVEELGLRPLRNTRVEIARDGAAFDLAGVDDAHGHLVSGRGGEDLERALAGRDPARPVVLLAHDPTTFKRAARRGVDLQLSGHTHGGQIWPFHYLVRLDQPTVQGLTRHGARTQLYTSRGTGFWGPPFRVFAPSEITLLTVRAG
jgi:hypothetical protein